jgi:hypothetical protein
LRDRKRKKQKQKQKELFEGNIFACLARMCDIIAL